MKVLFSPSTVTLALLSALAGLMLVSLRTSAGDGAVNPFFAMDTNLRDGKARTPQETASLLKRLGYDGYGHGGTENIEAWLAALDQEGVTFFNTYVGFNLDQGSQIDPAIIEILPILQNRGAMLWLYVQGKKPSQPAPQTDALAVRIIRELADLAHPYGVQIALYPHTGFFIDTTDDALRIARQVNRRNVGVTLNLCHWLKVEGEDGMSALMERALPYLFQVSINGAEQGNTQAMGWDKLIQPLDSGSFNTRTFVKTLRSLGYEGPIGLQGYGIKGDSEENLKRSIIAWNAWAAQ